MLTSTQISLLGKALKGLTWLISLSLLLLAIGLSSMVGWKQPIKQTKPQFIVYSNKGIKAAKVLTPALLKGKLLFTTNCQQCHEISDNKVVGPGLLGVAERVPDQAWLVQWIKNPSALLSLGDVYANYMVKAFAPVLMPGFPNLKETEIKLLIDYINSFPPSDPIFAQ